jgi:hypothetical protein
MVSMTVCVTVYVCSLFGECCQLTVQAHLPPIVNDPDDDDVDGDDGGAGGSGS